MPSAKTKSRPKSAKTTKKAVKKTAAKKTTTKASQEKPATKKVRKVPKTPEEMVKMKRAEKKQIIGENQKHEKDTGSAPVQVALLTDRIEKLTEHLKTHPKDNHSRRGLLDMVNRRRKLLGFVRKKSKEAYDTLIEKLGIRG